MVRTIGSRDTSPDLLEEIMRMHRSGSNSAEIGRATGVKPVTVRSIIARGGRQGKRIGAPRKLNQRDERALLRVVRSNPQATCVELKKQLPMIGCTPRTIQNTLRRRISGVEPHSGPLLTAKHRQNGCSITGSRVGGGKSVSQRRAKAVCLDNEPAAASYRIKLSIPAVRAPCCSSSRAHRAKNGVPVV